MTNEAILSSDKMFTSFMYNGHNIRFRTSSRLERYTRIVEWDKGYIVVENINNPQTISVFDAEDRLMKLVEVPEQINGYEYQFVECMEQMKKGEKESISMPLDDSIFIMELMDGIRKQWGLVYPQEK